MDSIRKNQKNYKRALVDGQIQQIKQQIYNQIFMQGWNQGFNQGFNQGSNNPEVPAHFVPQANTHYRIVSVLDHSKALTISNHKLTISNYTGDNSQRFTILPQGNKYAFLVQSTNTGLCVFYDKQDSGAEVLVDHNQHTSSWFMIERATQGEHANRGYFITTFCGKSLDIEGGNANNGNRVIQWEKHNGNNQLWLIIPADQPEGFNQNQGFNQGQNNWGNNSEHGHHGHHGHHKHHKHHGHGHHDQKSGSGQGFGIEMQGFFKKNYTYAITSAGKPSMCITIQPDGHGKIFDFQGMANQKFTFEFDQGHNKYHIRSAANGQYLTCGNGIFAGGALKTQTKGNHTELGLNWTLEPSTNPSFNGAYVIRSYSTHVIDVPGNNFANGNQLEKHGFNNNGNQNWYIVEK